MHIGLEPNNKVSPCPFCGGDNLDLHNTHTACYTVECISCGANVTGKSFGTNRRSEDLTLRDHRNAKSSALAAWNRRAPGKACDCLRGAK